MRNCSEGEILPIGWTEDEGRFGEFSHIRVISKWNPVIRIAITHRKDAIFYALHMPREMTGFQARQSRLLPGGFERSHVEPRQVDPGSCCYWGDCCRHIRSGLGRENAVLALLSVAR
jgi:2,5-furandicarboxylate decarboxylase 1